MADSSLSLSLPVTEGGTHQVTCTVTVRWEQRRETSCTRDTAHRCNMNCRALLIFDFQSALLVCYATLFCGVIVPCVLLLSLVSHFSHSPPPWSNKNILQRGVLNNVSNGKVIDLS